ncbi:uncharacterized protein LOC113301570 [Papaver somniferum]|uniref:uncharacterized protein LOC113301570 n=1 Tax=Papaver somniferum TaxID=3469 RepID=UPI000E6F6C75|nr:uncharacterized protein LOC113301570 [Papaver somniferum]
MVSHATSPSSSNSHSNSLKNSYSQSQIQLPFQNICNFVSPKLDSPNYLFWRHQFEFIMMSTSLLRFVDESYLPSSKMIMIDEGYNINDLDTDEVVAEGAVYNNIYPISVAPPHVISYTSILASPSLWHKRLGYPCSDILKKLSSTTYIKLSNQDLDSFCHIYVN